MMIVEHLSGAPTSLSTILQLHTSIAAADNPLIGSDGIRGPWSDPPTDAQLRSVGYSYLISVEPPELQPGELAQEGQPELIDGAWRQSWVVIPAPSIADLRAVIVAQIKQAAREHILVPLPEWKQANATARALQITRLQMSRELTESEADELALLEGAWAWVTSVRSASDVVEAAIQSMTAAELHAWQMPTLPEWPL